MQSKQIFQITQNKRELPFLDRFGVKYKVLDMLPRDQVRIEIELKNNIDLLAYSNAMNWAGYDEGKRVTKEVYLKKYTDANEEMDIVRDRNVAADPFFNPEMGGEL